MDVNGTRYHLLLGRDDWSLCTDEASLPLRLDQPDTSSLWFDPNRSALSLSPRLFQFRDAPRDIPPTPIDRRGASRDRYGNWYAIDSTNRAIQVRSSGSNQTSTFWPVTPSPQPAPEPGDFTRLEPAPPPPSPRFAGLAVTADHRLVVGVLDPPGLLVFDLHSGGPPTPIAWPTSIPFTPFDMTPAPDGGVWILDRVHARYWALDARLQVINTDQQQVILQPGRTDDFQPLLTGPQRQIPPRLFPSGFPVDAAPSVSGGDPVAIEALPDGSVLILVRMPGSPFSLISRYRLAQPLGDPLSTSLILAILDDQTHAGVRLVAHDLAFVPASKSTPDTLYVASETGNQSFAFELSVQNDRLALTPTPVYLPMRRFGGKALVSAGGSVYYDFGDFWVPLVAQQRPRYQPEATLRSPVFDGREPACVWHRLMIDAYIPPGASVQVWTRAADSLDDLTASDWQPEPAPYQRRDGSELSPLAPTLETDDGTWELLFQQARGRYLQLQLTLNGDGRSTPRLRALRAYYPRFSYLNHYLPALYREDPVSASFLDRFLAIFEGVYTTIEDRIASVQVLFAVRSAPSDTLDWLATWLGVTLDPSWDETRRRLFLTHAMDVFQFRGTIRGLLIALRLAFDDCVDDSLFTDDPDQPTSSIRIVERFRTRWVPGVVFGDPTAPAGPRLVSQTQTTRWQPVQGAEALHRLYRQLVLPTDSPGLASSEFPIQPPTSSVAVSTWRQFALNVLGFVPSSTSADLPAWQAFLDRRYRRIDQLNLAYHLTGLLRFNSFDEVPLPTRLPTSGDPLRDWYQFESIVLAMEATAHRFSVLLPASPSLADDPAERQRRLALASRIIALEKPAHTVFDVKFYWSAFRVGDARLGYDSRIDLGGRSPGLLNPMFLGRGFLAESYLAAGHPQDVSDRFVVGRDAPAHRLSCSQGS